MGDVTSSNGLVGGSRRLAMRKCDVGGVGRDDEGQRQKERGPFGGALGGSLGAASWGGVGYGGGGGRLKSPPVIRQGGGGGGS